MLSNLSTQFRLTQTRNTGLLSLLTPRADRARADDSKQILPPLITHHTVYKKTRNLQRNHVCQWETYSYLVNPLSRLVGRPPFEPSLSKVVLPLIVAANGNGAISLTQTFNRILFYIICSVRYFGVQKTKNGDRGTTCGLLPDIILLTQCYFHRGTRLNAMKRFRICSL